MSGLRIRPAEACDLGALTRLEQLSFSDPWSAELLQHEIALPEALLLVALRDESVEGYAAFRRGYDEAELLRLAVRPEARRGGVGRDLLADGLDRLRSEGWRVCHLEVRAGNAPALALYEGSGFRAIGLRPAYYRDGEDAALMARVLAAPDAGTAP